MLKSILFPLHHIPVLRQGPELQVRPVPVFSTACEPWGAGAGSDFRTATHFPHGLCSRGPDPKSLTGVNCSVCQVPAWKVRAVFVLSLLMGQARYLS